MARFKRLLIVCSLFLVAAVLLSPLDVRVATILAKLQLPGDLGEIVTVAETFGHGIGVIMVLIAVWLLSEESRRYMPALLASSLGAGMVANFVKLLVARQRPRDFDFATYDVMSTFGQLLPGYDINMQSFPSAHSATGIGFAIALAAYFPRGKWLFYTLAAIASFSRMHVGAHFMSDVLVGSAIGIVVAKLSLVYLQVDRLPKILNFVTRTETNVRGAHGHKIAA